MCGCWQCISIAVGIMGKNYNEIDTGWRRGPADALKPLPIAFDSLILCYGNAIGGNVRCAVRIFRSAAGQQTCSNCIAASRAYPTAVERSDETCNKQKKSLRHDAHLILPHSRKFEYKTKTRFWSSARCVHGLESWSRIAIAGGYIRYQAHTATRL